MKRSVAWYLTIAVVCAHFGLSYVGREAVAGDLDLPTYAAGHAHLPFQYRALTGWLLRGLVGNRFFLAVARHAPSHYHDPYSLAFFLVAFFSLAGSVIATSGTIYRLTGDALFARWSSLVVVYMAYFGTILMYGLVFTVPYDLPSLFFFCLGVNLIVRAKPVLYYPVFVLAVLTQEIAFILTVFFAAWEWFRLRDSLRSRLLRIVPQVVVQAAIWIAIRIFLVHLYAQNVSVAADRFSTNQLIYNLKELATPAQWPLLLSVCGFSLPVLVWQRRRIGNRALAWACAIVLPLWFAGIMCAGDILEVREFTELIAIVAPAMAMIFYHGFYRLPEEGGGQLSESGQPRYAGGADAGSGD